MTPVTSLASPDTPQALAERIKTWGCELGFQQIGITDTDLAHAEPRLLDWLARGYHGEMDYMARHGTKRSRPAELVTGTLSVISARMDYQPESRATLHERLADPAGAFISRYALGRDYHKVLRRRLQHLADRLAAHIGPFGHRVFVDSAPVMEKPLAEKAGLGWIGKHSNLINPRAGSWFFLGEIYTDLPLPPDQPMANHCGRCRACLDACPTGAIVAPYQVDGRRCISYLTIELKGAHPRTATPTHRQPHPRLRRLPARLPLEPLRPAHRRKRLPAPSRPGHRHPDRPVRLGRADLPQPHRGFGHSPTRARTLVAQSRRCARQCPRLTGSPDCTRSPQRPPQPAGARACGLGACWTCVPLIDGSTTIERWLFLLPLSRQGRGANGDRTSAATTDAPRPPWRLKSAIACLHPIVQQTSVGQAGQRIEKGQLLAGFALGVVVLQDEVDDLVGMLSGQRLGREEQVAFHECNGAGSR
jgi:ferredoxin